MKNTMSRRKFSRWLGLGTVVLGAKSTPGFPGLFALADSAAGHAFPETGTEPLVQYAWFILPLLEPSHERYRAVVKKVADQAGQVPEIASTVKAGSSELNAIGKDSWLNSTSLQKAEIVRKLEGTAFFGYMHWITCEIVMRDPALWETLGYQGSAIEHGGYLTRGFNDIDWLPQPRQGV